jgi:hypothetical protein
MTVSWMEPARRLADDSFGGGMDGLWSLLFAARRAVLHLALLPGLDDDLAFTEAALDLREAAERSWSGCTPDLPRRAAAVDLGEAPLDQVSACRAAVTGLLIAALDTGRAAAVGGCRGARYARGAGVGPGVSTRGERAFAGGQVAA